MLLAATLLQRKEPRQCPGWRGVSKAGMSRAARQ
jgi:hypothetical protein